MYVNEQNRPLTFDDLARAVKRSAGLGQTQPCTQITDAFGTYCQESYVSSPLDIFNASVPVNPITSQPSNTNPASPNYDPFAVQLAAAGTPFQAPWGTLAAVAGGLILFGLLVGKR